jgi:hypothetical protein
MKLKTQISLLFLVPVFLLPGNATGHSVFGRPVPMGVSAADIIVRGGGAPTPPPCVPGVSCRD